MNRKQRTVILAGLGVILLMLLIPPWKRQAPAMQFAELNFPGRTLSLGYAPFTSAPHRLAEVNTIRLAIQCAVVAVITAGAFVMLGWSKEAGK